MVVSFLKLKGSDWRMRCWLDDGLFGLGKGGSGLYDLELGFEGLPARETNHLLERGVKPFELRVDV
jgi:hypothetical protein